MSFKMVGVITLSIALGFVGSKTFADESGLSNLVIVPGQSIVVNPSNTATTVTCNGSNIQVIESFCVCIDPGRPYMTRLQKNYVMTDGSIKNVYIGDYDNVSQCEQARQGQEICSR